MYLPPFNVYSKFCKNYQYFLFDVVYNTSTGLTIRASCKQVCYFYISNWDTKFSNRHTSTLEIVKMWPTCRCFGVWDFAITTSNVNAEQIPNLRNVTHIFGISEFEISRIQNLRSTHDNSRNREKWPAVRDFANTEVKHRQVKISKIRNKGKVRLALRGLELSELRGFKCLNNIGINQFPKCKKEKLSTSGFWVSESRDFKSQTSNTNNFLKCERGRVGPAFWDFENSGFRVSGFQVPKHHIQQSPNFESNRMWDPLLRDFKFWYFGIYKHMVHKHKWKRKSKMWKMIRV